MSYLLIVEGQEIPLTAEVAATDETVRNCIAPFYPSAATAILRREEVDPTFRRSVKKEDNIFDKGHQKTGESIVFPELS